MDGLLARLLDGAERTRIAIETKRALAQGWAGILISSVESPRNRGLIGKSVAAIANHRACEPVETVLDLIREECGHVNILEINQSEANLRQTLTHPLACIISDAFYVKGRPHPRLYGTFPFLLGEISRECGWLTLAEAVHKISDKPACRFGIEKRGRLEKGFFADLVVLDPRTVNSPATYENPAMAPVGIQHVFRNGAEMDLNSTRGVHGGCIPDF
ncbi:MAG TPA: amidohydrolase family protein [Bryobacteraceae bacterium]|nr:amidohydrolase family protein [Bryobacteraceae bacterium]